MRPAPFVHLALPASTCNCLQLFLTAVTRCCSACLWPQSTFGLALGSRKACIAVISQLWHMVHVSCLTVAGALQSSASFLKCSGCCQKSLHGTIIAGKHVRRHDGHQAPASHCCPALAHSSRLPGQVGVDILDRLAVGQPTGMHRCQASVAWARLRCGVCWPRPSKALQTHTTTTYGYSIWRCLLSMASLSHLTLRASPL
jgi:hypothetical protein